jgi:hypothetical protein
MTTTLKTCTEAITRIADDKNTKEIETMTAAPKIANKPRAYWTQGDRIASLRLEQGASHARQGRTDLYGLCVHYDDGFDATQDEIHESGLEALIFTPA